MFVLSTKGLLKRSPFFVSISISLLVGLMSSSKGLAHGESQNPLETKDPSYQEGTKFDLGLRDLEEPGEKSESETTNSLSGESKSEIHDKPKRSRWGLGLGFGWVPNYAGAKKSDFHYLPFPVFRGDRFKIDRVDGISGRVGNTSRLKFSWSFIFQFPMKSKDIEIRQDMPDLDWFFGIGPMLKYTLWKRNKNELFLRVPIRPNFCTNFRSRFQFCGLDISPGLRFIQHLNSWGKIMYRMETYTYSRQYSDYYYSVTPDQARPNRPAYEAKSGFLGFGWGIVHTLPMSSWDFVTAATVYDYSLSRNRDSPLFVSPYNWAIFFGLSVDLF